MSKTVSVLEAIKRLSGVCDGARTQDGSGFNKPDSGFFKSLQYVSELTERQQVEYRKDLLKYKRQLGVDDIIVIDSKNNPIEVEKKQRQEKRIGEIKANKKSIKLVDGFSYISFEYNIDFVNDIKHIDGRRFDRERMCWIIPVRKDNVVELIDYLEFFHFDFNKAEIEKIASSSVNPNTITIAHDSLIIHFEFDRAILDAVKKISGRKFNYDTKAWTVIMDTTNVSQVVHFTSSFNCFDIEEKVTERINYFLGQKEAEKQKMQQNLISSSSMAAELDVEGFKGVLMPFQKAGVKYIIENKRVIVGDEMGLGKTIETIAAVQKSNSYPVLISCPNSLKYNWQREYSKFVDRSVVIINSDSDINSISKSEDVYIVNYNTLVKYSKELASFNFRAVVSDESHYLKNNKAQRTKDFSSIVDKCNPELVLLLTGTLIVNRPSELISPLTILNKLNDFGGFWNFASRYCGAHRTRFGLEMGGALNLEELHTKLRSLCYIRRNKSEVLTELPAKTRQVIELDITNRSKYNKAKDNLISYLRNEKEESVDFLNSISDLSVEEQKEAVKKWHDDKAHGAEQAEHLVQINELKQLAIEGKMEEVKSWISDVIESGEKLVVFAIHTKTVDELSSYFNCKKINGSVSSEDRDIAVQDFQNNPNTKLIVLNIAAGSVGLTLTAAQKLAFVELGWTPGEHDQAEDRIHRIGQKGEAVNIYYLLGQGTIDMDIFDLIEEKRIITTAVNKGEITSKTSVSIMNELISKLLN